jgi:hypothetical protein
MEIAYKQANLQQLEEKVNKEALERELETQEKLGHIQFLTGNDFYTENTVKYRLFRKLANQHSAETEYCHTTGKA